MRPKKHSTPSAQRTKPGHAGNDQLRQHIAADAARILAEEGVHDFHSAKRKAAIRLGLPETKHLPGNDEVHAALEEYLRLFHGPRLAQNTRRLRGLALDAMRFLSSFEPRLVGPVLSGTVTATSEIEIHLTADTPEEIGFWLQEHQIPYQQTDRRLRFGGDRIESLPAYRFTADNIPIEICVFARRAARETPLSPVDGKPMKRANLKELEQLVHATESK